MMGPVLVVDDEDDVREIVQMTLEERGVPVATAASGEEALARAFAEPRPSLVLLDLIMPGLSGRETAQTLRREERTAQIPIVVFTGDVHGCEVAEELRADGCLRKPIDSEELLVAVERFRT